MTFLGWLRDPFKWLSDLQLGDEKVTLNHLACVILDFFSNITDWFICFWWVILDDVPRELFKILSFGLSSGKPETTKLQPVFEGPSEFGRPCRVIQAQEAKKYTHEAIQVVTFDFRVMFSLTIFGPTKVRMFFRWIAICIISCFFFKGSFLAFKHSENSKKFTFEKSHQLRHPNISFLFLLRKIPCLPAKLVLSDPKLKATNQPTQQTFSMKDGSTVTSWTWWWGSRQRRAAWESNPVHRSCKLENSKTV